ncbi:MULTISPECIES: ImmA/IrrE family metallo-endopeptidase [Desulfovibrio]|uniref:IrrE N-terminal-like domain-containing protein n=1 Tax=Desulfovibrio desulfuricans TaxID=876 RepID=A0AA94L3E5_DESDE|nr:MULTISPECIES: ImmA/IrrE family metallo-endopeptidase [Desulfovibrio]ATD82415.1 ImmA/IrrE family metallo-endopeptidase [Desulfovibrio sp. G11]SFW72080.1 protein of unknown function [Desulfovibrio desulfuricans]SPD35203.1 Metallopeptidase IrrE N-terminal-like domain [Desulfovibrio sp. G11]
MGKSILLKNAKNFAEKVLEENELLELPVDIELLASKNQIVVDKMPDSIASKSIYGALLITDNNPVIFYSTLINNIGFQRFTVAHELGHFFLDGHIEALINTNGLHLSESDFCSKNKFEFEADSFAAGLLMPEKLCKKIIGQEEDGWAAIKLLAKTTMSSYTAAAIRYIDFSSAPSAIIVSLNGIIQYSFCTRTFSKYGNLLFRGMKLPTSSLSHSIASSASTTFENELESDVMHWVQGGKSTPCNEQSISLGHTGKLLTVLTCIEQDEDDEEDDLFESKWQFNFR